MKVRFWPILVFCGCLLYLNPLIAKAGSDSSATREIQPLYSRYAQTVTRWTLRGGARFFKDAEMQEAVELDGTCLDVELTVPLSERFQMRLYYPFDTDCEARSTRYGQVEIDVEGDGGILDFPSLIIDYQFKQAASADDYNLAAYLGVGILFEELEATGQHSGYWDIYNHQGAVALFGLKADKQLDNGWHFIGNLGGRYYWDSDDLHPKNEDHDKFWLLDCSAAILYAPSCAWAFPGLEVVFQGDLDGYNSLMVVPEIIIPLGPYIDISSGVGLGIGDDGPSLESRLQLILRY